MILMKRKIGKINAALFFLMQLGSYWTLKIREI